MSDSLTLTTSFKNVKIHTLYFRHLLSHGALAGSVRCCLFGVWITTEHSHHYYSATHTQHTDCGGGPCAVWTYKLCECVSGATELNKQIDDEFNLWMFRMETMNTIYIVSQRNINSQGPIQDVQVLSRLTDWLMSGSRMLSSCHHIPGSWVCRRWQALISLGSADSTAECQGLYAVIAW